MPQLWQQAAHTANHILAAQQEPYKKNHLFTQNIEEFSRNKSQENGPLAEKEWDKKSNGTRLKKKRGDGKWKQNDSVEVPDWRAVEKTGGLFTSSPRPWGKLLLTKDTISYSMLNTSVHLFS